LGVVYGADGCFSICKPGWKTDTTRHKKGLLPSGWRGLPLLPGRPASRTLTAFAASHRLSGRLPILFVETAKGMSAGRRNADDSML
jgi:hypothetical protein